MRLKQFFLFVFLLNLSLPTEAQKAQPVDPIKWIKNEKLLKADEKRILKWLGDRHPNTNLSDLSCFFQKKKREMKKVSEVVPVKKGNTYILVRDVERPVAPPRSQQYVSYPPMSRSSSEKQIYRSFVEVSASCKIKSKDCVDCHADQQHTAVVALPQKDAIVLKELKNEIQKPGSSMTIKWAGKTGSSPIEVSDVHDKKIAILTQSPSTAAVLQELEKVMNATREFAAEVEKCGYHISLEVDLRKAEPEMKTRSNVWFGYGASYTISGKRKDGTAFAVPFEVQPFEFYDLSNGSPVSQNLYSEKMASIRAYLKAGQARGSLVCD